MSTSGTTDVDNIVNRIADGYFQTNTATKAEGWPVDNNSWCHLISQTHTNPNNYYALQISGSFSDNKDFFIRKTNGNGAAPWNRIYHENNLHRGVSVLDYGADPATSIDSSAAFQAALNKIASMGGGTLLIPAGTYRINNTLTYGQGGGSLTIRGEGHPSTIHQHAQVLFEYTAGGKVEVHDLRVFGAVAAGTAFRINTASEYRLTNIRGFPANKNLYWDRFFDIINPLLGTVKDVYISNLSVDGHENNPNNIRGSGYSGRATSSISTNNHFDNVIIIGFNYGWFFESTTSPGNEGNLFTNCVGVANIVGLRCNGGPQSISWIGGHNNAYRVCFQLETQTVPLISNCMMFRDCLFNLAGQHVVGEQISGADISHNNLRVIGNEDGRDMRGASGIHLSGGDNNTVAFNQGIFTPDVPYGIFCTSSNSDCHFNRFGGGGLQGTGTYLAGSNGSATGNRRL